MSEVLNKTDAIIARGSGSRRSWSRAEKRRIVEEAFRPGASAADVARTYGLNANQVFNWRRRALAAAGKSKSSLSVGQVPQGGTSAPQGSAMFLPIGTIVEPGEAGAALLVSPPAAPAIGAGVADHSSAVSPLTDMRSGLIEIDLACGTRLRVDAFVNKRALRRVVSILKASA